MPYIGNTQLESVILQQEFTASSGQTAVSANYEISNVDVYVNGVLLINGSDYTATNGETINFTVALEANDTISVRSIEAIAVFNNSFTLGPWAVTESGGSLYFAENGTNKMKLDADGNLDVAGSVNANATIV